MRQAPRILELDGIRGMAILMVVLWHYFVFPLQTRPATPLSYLQAAGRLTWTGVDLFFVLSGFLIGGILLDARDSPGYFRTFYVRRISRIIPLYVVWFLLTLAVLHFAATGRFAPSINDYILRDKFTMVPYAFYLQNFWETAKNTLGWYSSGGTWSLAIEEQFYLTLPLVIRLVPKRSLPWILLTGVVTATLLRLAIYFFFPQHRMGIFVSMPCRADALLLGVIGAIFVRDERFSLRIRQHSMLLCSLICILLSGAAMLTLGNVGQTGLAMSAGGYTLMALLYLCIVLFAVTQPGSWLAAAMRWRLLRWMGTIAYGVYLLHFQILLAVFALTYSSPPDRITLPRMLGPMLISSALTVILCSASWLYFEKPLVRFGHGWKYSFEPAPIPRRETEAAAS